MATSATGVSSLPGPRLACSSMTDRLFLVNTLRSTGDAVVSIFAGGWNGMSTCLRSLLVD
jgi:hypothetical protein